MSSARILVIDRQTGSCTEFAEYSNSWGSAPVIWNIFAEKYWGKKKSAWLVSSELQDFWNLCKDSTIPLAHRAVFAMTFDRAIISRKFYQRAIDDIKKFVEDFEDYPDFWTGVNHWPRIALDIVEISGTDAEAVGFHMTTVTENPCMVFDAESETYRLHPELFELYDELEKYESGGEG